MTKLRLFLLSLLILVGLAVAPSSPVQASFAAERYVSWDCPADYSIRFWFSVTGHSYVARADWLGNQTEAISISAPDNHSYSYTKYFQANWGQIGLAAHTRINGYTISCYYNPGWSW